MSGPGGSDWFGGARPAKAAEPAEPAEAAERVEVAGSAEIAEPVELAEPVEVIAATGPVPELVAELADAANAVPGPPMLAEPVPAPATPAEPTPDSDPRVRLRALTGGLADLSDAMAAIGIESVALRGPSPSGPAVPRQESQPAPAADFRVRCPDCGPQYVAVADVRFVETGDGAEANRYLFTCPACGARVRRPAGPELAGILKSAGVATLALRRGPGQAL